MSRLESLIVYVSASRFTKWKLNIKLNDIFIGIEKNWYTYYLR